MMDAETKALCERLREAAKLLPIKTHDGQYYAEAAGTDFQAMTVRPASFDALNSLPDTIDLIEHLSAENARLRATMERIATVDMGGGFLGAKACRDIARAAMEGGEG